jgi:hypothetical protein
MSRPASHGDDRPTGLPPNLERRGADRYPSETLIACRPVALSPKDLVAALLRDVSARGFSLIVRYRFAPGTLLVVELGDLTGAASDPVVVKVVRTEAPDGGRWLVGVELRKELTERQLQACRGDVDQESWVGVACAADAGA